MRQRFPSVRERSAPYIPRQSYIAPTICARGVAARRGAVGANPCKTFTRDILLLDKDDILKVPRGSTRGALYDTGSVANLVNFSTRWDEQQVYRRVEECFSNTLDLTKPHPRYV